MKKLCSLLTCVGLVLSISSFAGAEVDKDFTKVVHPTVSTANMQTTLTGDTFTTTVEGVGDQATLLIVKGENVTADSETIQGIDQNGTMTFTYKLRGDIFAEANKNQKYTLKVGGTNLSAPMSQVIVPYVYNEPDVPTGYTISGTVENAAPLQVLGEGAELDDLANDGYKTTVSLYNLIDGDLVCHDPILDENENPIVVTVDPSSRRFSIPNMPSKRYYLKVERAGFLSYFAFADVEDDNVDLGDLSLVSGDVNGNDNVFIDDAFEIVENYADLFELYFDGYDYPFVYDINANLNVFIDDAFEAVENSGNEIFDCELYFSRDNFVLNL